MGRARRERRSWSRPTRALRYVRAAKAAGGNAEEVVVPGDHDSIADPDAPSFPAIEKLITEALAQDGG